MTGRTNERGAAVIEGTIRPTTTRTRPGWRTLLALLLALGGVVVLLAFSSGPAEAATTFTVNYKAVTTFP